MLLNMKVPIKKVLLTDIQRILETGNLDIQMRTGTGAIDTPCNLEVGREVTWVIIRIVGKWTP
jgi:hypothetical protein